MSVEMEWANTAATDMEDFKSENKVGNRKLPPDPDEQNNDRADWAEEALITFMACTGTDPGDSVADLMADLRHWCDRYDLDFDNELARAQGMYGDETDPNGPV